MINRIIWLRRQRREKHNGPSMLRLLFAGGATLFLLGFLPIFSAAGLVAGVYVAYAKDLPAPEEMQRRCQEAFQTTRIYDRTGQHLLYEIFDPQGGNRTVIPLERIPRQVQEATIAIEDKYFYSNPGIDPTGITRAFWCDITGRCPFHGGSSITQQLVKNVLIPPEERYKRSYARKIKEVILALELTRRYSKDQILEWYLNTISYGNMAYGVQAAAEAYFGKDIQGITLAEGAMLAALPQSPAANSPLLNPQKAKERQHLVLDAMWREGYISTEDIIAAKAEVLHPKAQKFEILAPHFVVYVRQILEERYGPDLLYRGGLKVYTTLDLNFHRAAQEIAREHIARLQEEEHNVSNAAVVVIVPPTGEVLTMLGSLDYFDESIQGQVNVAMSPRQPGSSFKPLTYAEAFIQGYTPGTMVIDYRTSFPTDMAPYAPENYDRKYHGPVLLRQALACSYNIPAVKVLDMVSVPKVVALAHRMGINTLNRDDYGLSLTLGGGEVYLLDMTYAFSIFANGGEMAGQPVSVQKPGYRELDPVAILRVEDAQGHILEEYDPSQVKRKRILSPQVTFLINDVLSDNQARVPAFGMENRLELSRPAAAKTGTTHDWRDAWTIGYTPQLAIGVWVGNSDGEPMEEVPGSRGAAPIWHDLMERVLAPLPAVDFPKPPGIEKVEICAASGLLPTEYCLKRGMEVFIKGTAPTTYDNVYRPFRICKASGKLATIYCPPDQIEEKVFEIYPPEAADWVRENDIHQPPVEYDDTFGPGLASEDVTIVSPSAYAYLRDRVTITGRARSSNFAYYRLEYGQGLDPSAWIQIGPNHHQVVEEGFLEEWDVKGLEGLYTLQLTVVARDGGLKKTAMQVTIDNTPPMVHIAHPVPNAIYSMKDDEWVNVQAEVVENFSMDRVEFYLDDQLIGMSTVPPYTKKWTIRMQSTGLEKHLIHVVAFDAAGNRAESEKVPIRVIIGG